MQIWQVEALGIDPKTTGREAEAGGNSTTHRREVQPDAGIIDVNFGPLPRHSCRDGPGNAPDDDASDDHVVAELLATVENDYQALVAHLSGTLRSSDAAMDALHDTYVRLASRPPVGEVRRPFAYIRQAAINLAKNRRCRDAFIKPAPATAAGQLADETPNPEQIAGARSEMAQALALLDQLPSRRREIFLARWRDDMGQAEIAAKFGLHKRTVQKELARAEAFLRSNLTR